MRRVIQKDKSWVTDKATCYFQRLKCAWYDVVKQFTGRNFRVHPKSIRKLGSHLGLGLKVLTYVKRKDSHSEPVCFRRGWTCQINGTVLAGWPGTSPSISSGLEVFLLSTSSIIPFILCFSTRQYGSVARPVWLWNLALEMAVWAEGSFRKSQQLFSYRFIIGSSVSLFEYPRVL